MISSDVRRCDTVWLTNSYVLDLFGRGSDSQLWDWLMISANGVKERERELRAEFLIGPHRVDCWLVIGSQDADICINVGFLFFFFLINGTEMVDPSLLNQSQSLSMICYRDTGRCALSWFRPSDWSLSRFCLTPQWTELLHNKSLSHTFNLRILENSAILFSIYINNSKFVLFKFALGLHTCVYIYSVCNVYTCQHVCSKMFDVKVGTPTGFSCLFLFLKLDNI